MPTSLMHDRSEAGVLFTLTVSHSIIETSMAGDIERSYISGPVEYSLDVEHGDIRAEYMLSREQCDVLPPRLANGMLDLELIAASVVAMPWWPTTRHDELSDVFTSEAFVRYTRMPVGASTNIRGDGARIVVAGQTVGPPPPTPHEEYLQGFNRERSYYQLSEPTPSAVVDDQGIMLSELGTGEEL